MFTLIDSVLKYDTINQINFGEKAVFFKFGADWCAPCQQLETILNDFEYCEKILYKIDVENEDFENIILNEDIVTIPVTIVKYAGKTEKFSGVKTKEELIVLLNKMKQ